MITISNTRNHDKYKVVSAHGSRIAKINRSRTHGCNLTFDPLKINRSRASNETIKQFLPIKSPRLGQGHKHLNRHHASDYPLVLHCNKLSILIGNRLAHKLRTSLSTGEYSNHDCTCWVVLHESSISFLAIKLLKLHNLFEHNTDYLMSLPTGVLLLHALQQLKLDLRS